MSYKDEYNYWLSSDYFDEATRVELRGLTDERGDRRQILQRS